MYNFSLLTRDPVQKRGSTGVSAPKMNESALLLSVGKCSAPALCAAPCLQTVTRWERGEQLEGTGMNKGR